MMRYTWWAMECDGQVTAILRRDDSIDATPPMASEFENSASNTNVVGDPFWIESVRIYRINLSRAL